MNRRKNVLIAVMLIVCCQMVNAASADEKHTTLDRLCTRDMDLPLMKSESPKDIVLLKKGLVKQKKREKIMIGTTNEILVVEQLQPPITEEAIKEADAISDIESHTEGDILKIILTGNGVITKYKAFSLDDPTRLVIDLLKITKAFPQRLIKINSPYIEHIRIGTHPDKVRLCLDSSRKDFPPHHIIHNDNRLEIVVGELQNSEAKEPAPAESGKVKPESLGDSSYLP